MTEKVKKEKAPAKVKFTASFGVTALASIKSGVLKSTVRKLVGAGLSGITAELTADEKAAVDGLSFTAVGVEARDKIDKCDSDCAKPKSVKPKAGCSMVGTPRVRKPRAVKAE